MLQYLDELLSVAGFLIGLFYRTFEGMIISMLLVCIALFIFINSLDITGRVLKRTVKKQNYLISFVSALIFGFANLITKVIIPWAWSATIAAVIGLFASVFTMYGLFRLALRLGKESAFLESLSDDLETKANFERVRNSMILFCVFLGLDGMDIMLLIQMIVIPLKRVYEIYSTVRAFLVSMIRWIRSCQARLHSKRKLINVINVTLFLQDVKYYRSAFDFDRLVWTRVFSVLKRKENLGYMFMIFVCGFPLLFFSYSIDFLNFNIKYAISLLLLMIPAIWSFQNLKNPHKGGSVVYIIISLGTTILIYLFPDFSPIYVELIASQAGFTDARASAVSLTTAVSLFSLIIGMPFFKMLVSVEREDLDGFVKWGKLAGFSPIPLVVLTTVVKSVLGEYTMLYSVTLFWFTLIAATYFYLLMLFVIVESLKSFKKSYRVKEVTPYIRRIFDSKPRMQTIFPASCMSISFFLLTLWIEPEFTSLRTLGLIAYSVVWFFSGVTIGAILLHRTQRGLKLGGLKIGVIAGLGNVTFVLSLLIFLTDEISIGVILLLLLIFITPMLAGLSAGLIREFLMKRGYLQPHDEN